MGTKGKKAVFLGVALALQSRNTIDVWIGLRKTKALVDTGSQITLVSQLFFFSKILSMQNSKLSRTDYVIKGASNNTLPILASYFFQLKRTAQFSGRLLMSSKVWIVCHLHLFFSGSQPFLGSSTSERMNLIFEQHGKIMTIENPSSDNDWGLTYLHWKRIFSEPVHLEVDDTVPPVKLPMRRVSGALKPQLQSWRGWKDCKSFMLWTCQLTESIACYHPRNPMASYVSALIWSLWTRPCSATIRL